jgi:hypothetical protein
MFMIILTKLLRHKEILTMRVIVTLVLYLLCAANVFAAATVNGDLSVSGNVYLKGTPLTSPDKLTRYQGPWSLQLYAPGDIVQFQGSLYVATSATVAQPPNTTFWALLSTGATPIDYSGTYKGTQSDLSSINNSISVTTPTTIITQTGSTFTGTFSVLESGMQGTFSGTVNGNILTFTNTISPLPQGCTSIQMQGMGFITNDVFTYFYSGIGQCGGANHITGSGIVAKQ